MAATLPRGARASGVVLAGLLLAGCGGTTTTRTAPAPPPSDEQAYAAAVEPVIPVDDAAIIVGEGACELFELGRTREQVLTAVRQLRHVDAAGNLLMLDTAQVPQVVDAATTHLCPAGDELDDSGGVHGGGSHSTAKKTPSRTSSARPSTPARPKPSSAPRSTR